MNDITEIYGVCTYSCSSSRKEDTLLCLMKLIIAMTKLRKAGVPYILINKYLACFIDSNDYEMEDTIFFKGKVLNDSETCYCNALEWLSSKRATSVKWNNFDLNITKLLKIGV